MKQLVCHQWQKVCLSTVNKIAGFTTCYFMVKYPLYKVNDFFTDLVHVKLTHSEHYHQL